MTSMDLGAASDAASGRFARDADALLGLLDSDFCAAGKSIKREAIRVELESAYELGRNDEAQKKEQA
jgi:hypothetical protein